MKTSKKTLSPRERYLRSIRLDKLKIHGIRIAILAAFIGLWELTTALGWVDSFFVSSPSRIGKTFVELIQKDLMRHIGITLLECVAGFAISTAVGAVFAIALWWSVTFRRVSEPYLVVLNALPKIALGPIIIIWVGANMNAIIMMAFLICIIVTIMSMLGSFTSCDGGKIFLLESMGASKFQVLTKLVLPLISSDIALPISASVRVSTLEVASSKISTGGSQRNTRAMVSSWR